MLEPGPGETRVVDAVAQRPVPSLGEMSHEGVVGVDDELRRGGERRDGGAPALRDVLELPVAVELIAEEVPERDDPRPHPPHHLRERELVDLEKRRARHPEPRGGWRRPPRRDSRPSCSTPGDTADRGSRASIALVVVFPFVAETSAAPEGSRAASASIAARVDLPEQLPGQGRAAAAPGEHATVARRGGRRTSRRSGAFPWRPSLAQSRCGAVLLWGTCKYRRLIYSDCICPGPVAGTQPSPGSTRRLSRSFSAGIRRRYSDEQILDRAACERGAPRAARRRCASSRPTRRREVHPQTVIEHFGTWNAAKRAAGLTPRRFISREELLDQLRELGLELGRTPTAHDLDANRKRVASKSLIWHTFGSLTAALREAGFDVPVGDEKLERAVERRRRARTRARPPAEDGRLEERPAPPARAPVRVAGLPAHRHRRRPLGGVPVPRPRASAGGRGHGAPRRLIVMP